MTLADSIRHGMTTLSVVMPLFVLAAFVASIISTPTGHRNRIIVYLLAGICAGLLGANVIQVIQLGGWNYQFLFYPFLFAKWFFIGYTISWGIGSLVNSDHVTPRRGVSGIIFAAAAIPFLLTLLDMTYVPYVFQRDRTYWDSLFSALPSDAQIQIASRRLSSEGRQRVSWQLQYHPDDITAPVLTKLNTLGFNVLHSKTVPADLSASTVAAVQAKLANEPSEWKRSQIVSELSTLASSPAIDDDTFRLLANIGDHHVVSALIRNKSNDDARMEWLRISIQTRVAQSKATNDSDRWYVDRLREQIHHLDQWWHFNKTGEWRPKHAQ